eukprot:m.292936 g.292936  ORF g.292936 m.292936 type:complete len:252 (-) comp17831_c1_seq1:914-1669(-)
MAPSHVVAAPVEQPEVDLPYRRLIGALMYITKRTRPEISFHVALLSRFCTRYQRGHYQDARKVLQYLVNTADVGLVINRSKSLELSCYTDASYGIDYVDQRSITGMCIFFGGNLISWTSCAQKTTARSTAAAEYLALDVGVKELLSLRNVLLDLEFPVSETIIMHCDNTAAIAIANGDTVSRRVRHVDIIYHFIREQVKRGLVKLVHCRTGDMVADVLTKPLDYQSLLKHRTAHGLICVDMHTCMDCVDCG